MEVYKVWALPYSLATTNGIIGYFLFLEVLRCFSSPGSLYLSYIFRQEWLDMTLDGFPHSEIFGSKLVWQLPEAYRSLLRPSSVSCVKASFTCAWVTFYDSSRCIFRYTSVIVQLTSYRYKPITALEILHIGIQERCRLSCLAIHALFIRVISKEIYIYPKLLNCETHRYIHPLMTDLEFTLRN